MNEDELANAIVKAVQRLQLDIPISITPKTTHPREITTIRCSSGDVIGTNRYFCTPYEGIGNGKQNSFKCLVEAYNYVSRNGCSELSSEEKSRWLEMKHHIPSPKKGGEIVMILSRPVPPPRK